MYGSERGTLYRLRRRRLLGLGAFIGVLFVAYAMNGFQVTPIWALFDSDQGTFSAGDPYDEWIYAVCDGDEQQITVLKDGRVLGVAGLDSLRNVRFPDWCDRLPTVDNPELDIWQEQLGRLQATTASPVSSAIEILALAEAMPAPFLYLKPLSDWIRNDVSHATDFLDTVAQRPMRFNHPNRRVVQARRDDFADLIETALEVVAPNDIDGASLNRWLASDQIASSGTALLKLAKIDGIDDRGKQFILEQLDKIDWSQRADVYAELAADLVHDGQYAVLLNEQFKQLPRQSRFPTMLQLLMRSDVDREFSIAALSTLDREIGSPDQKLQIYTAIADKLKNEADGPILLTTHLKDLAGNGMQRRLGATHLLGLDAPGETAYALGVLRAFADIHPMSQPKLIYSVLQSPQFDDPAVQEACLLAVRLQMQGPQRNELLTAMARHPALDSTLVARIDAELAASKRGSGRLP